ncbi:hypothetical protein N658DRAFT_484458 [Parathielavia hyrcaniae]|uniref:Uncharacterized protein n=1 Tax=Parathielavia hyrcaniae TaxID=113614 RepID=A0AAN6T3A1_9PEZI|nr:hypothetical protein N658DRAFT_484458 [Parathielavia hyrcaniae]
MKQKQILESSRIGALVQARPVGQAPAQFPEASSYKTSRADMLGFRSVAWWIHVGLVPPGAHSEARDPAASRSGAVLLTNETSLLINWGSGVRIHDGFEITACGPSAGASNSSASSPCLHHYPTATLSSPNSNSPALFSTKPDPEPPAPLLAAAKQKAAIERLYPNISRDSLHDVLNHSLPLPYNALGGIYCIKDALDLYRLPYWGFVLFRCTYRSQEKWEKFLALVQKHARERFEEAGLMDVYARVRWAVFEDAAGLDGVDIAETSRRFVDWVERGPGGKERSALTPPVLSGAPRYEFFLHVDEESLESVVDDAKARDKRSGYFCRMVKPYPVVEWDIKRDREGVYRFREDEQELEEEDMWEASKIVKIDDLVDLYGGLHQFVDGWSTLSSYPGNPDLFMP